MSDEPDAGRRPSSGLSTRGDHLVDPHADVGAYVVDALEAPERAEFRAHLESCASCRREVAEFQETTAQLALLVAARPPAGLRGATLAGIRGVRPLPPEQRPEVDEAPAVRHRPTSPDELPPLDEHPSVMPWSLEFGARPSRAEPAVVPAGRVNRLLAALAAAAVVLALALGGYTAITAAQRASDVAAARADVEQQTALLGAPDAQIRNTTIGGAPVSFVVSKTQGRALLVGEDVPAPAAGEVYQLWTLDGSTAASAGVVPSGGAVRVWLSGPVADADVLAVTLEPGPTGSTQPTKNPLASVEL